LAVNQVFKDADGELSFDAGAFVRALEYSSGTTPVLLGKPSPDFFLAGIPGIGCDPRDVVMIGDDAESDVAGALRAGIGQGIAVITEAKAIGYKRMLLDTGPNQFKAQGLYRSLGFTTASPYYELEEEMRSWLVFMELPLVTADARNDY
jgi:ribonucleotide monophosphatase NagD (HAD superfamily)